jgi:integrase
VSATPLREMTYDVRVWKTEKYVGRKVTTYTVRWSVAGRRWKKPHRTAAMAESFRSKLVTALREGTAFDIATGLPVTMIRAEAPSTTWYEFACTYIDMKWPTTSPKHRKGTAEALTSVTLAMLSVDELGDARELRSALLNWAFNRRRDGDEQPEHVTEQLSWVARNSRPLTDLGKPEVPRAVLASLGLKVDGTRAANRTAAWKRSILSTALNYAVELGLLTSNPIAAVRWTAPRAVEAVDWRCVVNPAQARALLDAVRVTPRSGQRLVAFFGTLYYSALRPEEAVALRRRNLDLPDSGWGWITLEKAAPEADRQWADTDVRREDRELKHRAIGETRRVPCPPALSLLLRQHLDRYGTDHDGRLFRGERGEPLAGVTYRRLWARAREKALTPEQYASPLAARPYDLRHAAVSTWLNSGVPPTQVARWAGHSVAVLLKIYAKCLDGHEHIALSRIDQALAPAAHPTTSASEPQDQETLPQDSPSSQNGTRTTGRSRENGADQD